jgi:hypothetical protein
MREDLFAQLMFIRLLTDFLPFNDSEYQLRHGIAPYSEPHESSSPLLNTVTDMIIS